MKNLTYLLFVTLISSVSLANDVIGNAVAVIGNVIVIRSANGEQIKLKSQDELFLNDIIKTGADGLAKLLLRDESVLKVSPSSELKISEMIAGPGADGRSTVDLLKGRIRSVIGNKLGANSEFNVNTPVAVAGVRGTDFEVVHLLIDGQWRTGVRCFNGAVAVNQLANLPGVAEVLVLPDQYTTTDGTSAPIAPESINVDDSLSERMGGENIDATDNGDAELDDVQLRDVILLLDTDETPDMDRLLQRIDTRLSVEAAEEVEESADVQIQIIDEPLIQGSELTFDINIPLPQ